jgi:hypothetical protein
VNFNENPKWAFIPNVVILSKDLFVFMKNVLWANMGYRLRFYEALFKIEMWWSLLGVFWEMRKRQFFLVTYFPKTSCQILRKEFGKSFCALEMISIWEMWYSYEIMLFRWDVDILWSTDMWWSVALSTQCILLFLMF